MLNISLIDKMKGSMNSMANWVMPYLLGYSCTLYCGFEDQLNTLNVHGIWNDLYNNDSTKSMMKHKFND